MPKEDNNNNNNDKQMPVKKAPRLNSLLKFKLFSKSFDQQQQQETPNNDTTMTQTKSNKNVNDVVNITKEERKRVSLPTPITDDQRQKLLEQKSKKKQI